MTTTLPDESENRIKPRLADRHTEKRKDSCTDKQKNGNMNRAKTIYATSIDPVRSIKRRIDNNKFYKQVYVSILLYG